MKPSVNFEPISVNGLVLFAVVLFVSTGYSQYTPPALGSQTSASGGSATGNIRIEGKENYRPLLQPADPQVDVDISACRSMYTVLKAMRDGSTKEKVAGMLDGVLETRPYRMMFRHYNRSWRPDHLPESVFKRMILSLRFDGEYKKGENERADAMRAQWMKYYPDLAPYERQLRQLETADLTKLINDGVRYAQGWLPPEWKIPNFYFPVIPNGGSPAFTIESTQGYDFLQLSQERPGDIDLNWLVGTVAHESHHLGIDLPVPDGLSAAETIAYQVVTLHIPEGVATKFISGPPAGRVPVLPEVPFNVFKGDLEKAWHEHVAVEEEILKRQVELFDKALAGQLTEDAFKKDLREYWLNGVVGRAYVLGAEMFGAIYIAQGKEGVFAAMRDPPRLFELYNAALDSKSDALKRCVRVPTKTVEQALAIGKRRAGPASIGE